MKFHCLWLIISTLGDKAELPNTMWPMLSRSIVDKTFQFKLVWENFDSSIIESKWEGGGVEIIGLLHSLHSIPRFELRYLWGGAFDDDDDEFKKDQSVATSGSWLERNAIRALETASFKLSNFDKWSQRGRSDKSEWSFSYSTNTTHFCFHPPQTVRTLGGW